MGQYETLKNKYNIAIARIKDLEEQLRLKNAQWEKREADFKVVEKNTRDLCEKILASNAEEMKLGKGKSWSETPVLQLIRNSMNAWIMHEVAFQESLNELADEIEKKTEIIDEYKGKVADLERKINILTVHGSDISLDDINKMLTAEKEANEQKDKKKQMGISSRSGQVVDDDEDDEDDAEDELLGEAAGMNADLENVTDGSIPHVKSPRNKKKDFDRFKNAQTNRENLDEKSDWLSDDQWEIIRIIGETGLSVYADILSKYKTDNGSNAVSDSTMKILMNQLADKKVVSKETISIYTGKLAVHELQPLGKRFYLERFNAKPVVSEASTIKREHNNYIHGYGIKKLADAIRETGEFKEVNEFQRKKAQSIRGNAASYIPDIVCVDKKGLTLYIEYEVGTTSQNDFNAKCAKLCDVTNFINIVVPNNEEAEKQLKKIEKFIENRAGGKYLYGVTIRVASAKAMKFGNIINNKAWKYVFRPDKNGTVYETNY